MTPNDTLRPIHNEILIRLHEETIQSVSDLIRARETSSQHIKNLMAFLEENNLVEKCGFIAAPGNGKSSQAYQLTEPGKRYVAILNKNKPISARRALSFFTPRVDAYNRPLGL